MAPGSSGTTRARAARRRPSAGAAAALAALLALASCSRAPGAPGHAPAADAFDLYRGLLLAGRVEVRLPKHGAEPARREAEKRLERLAARVSAGGALQATLLRPVDAGDPRAARVWIGDARTPGADELLGWLGVERNAEGFLVADRVFHRRDDVLVATFADPERPGLPLTVWYGNDLLHLERSIEDLTPAWRPLLRCLRGGRPELELDLEVGGAPRPLSSRDTGTPRRRARPEVRTQPIGPFAVELPADFDLAAWRATYFSALPGVLNRVEVTLGRLARPPEERRELPLRVFAHPEDFALATGGFAPWRLDPARNGVDVLMAPRLFGGRADARAGPAMAWARELAGDPATPWLLEALAVEASGFWWGRPLGEWVAHLVGGDLVPPLGELVDARSAASPHVLVPLRAALVRYLLAAEGPVAVRRLWAGTDEFRWNSKLRRGFKASLAVQLERHGGAARAAREAGRAASLAAPWRAGVALVPSGEPRDPRRGFGSRAAAASLAAAAERGANAFSMDVFGYVEPGLPDRAGVPPPERSADDVALLATLADGRVLGLGGMLKLHLQQERSGNWAGYRGMDDEDWKGFFDEYERQVVHAGLLAELAGAEILCLGSGVPLPTYTRSREGDGIAPELLAEKRARWEALIARARGAFSGALTYGARWENQAFSFELWPRLDYVGAQVFHPVRDAREPWVRQPDPTLVAMMRKNLTDLADLAQEVGAPFLATEVGFPATRFAWQAPAAAKGPPDADAQARMLSLWTAALAEARERRPELAGFFLWSWPVDPAVPLGAAGLFSPRGRPAEDVLGPLLEAR